MVNFTKYKSSISFRVKYTVQSQIYDIISCSFLLNIARPFDKVILKVYCNGITWIMFKFFRLCVCGFFYCLLVYIVNGTACLLTISKIGKQSPYCEHNHISHEAGHPQRLKVPLKKYNYSEGTIIWLDFSIQKYYVREPGTISLLVLFQEFPTKRLLILFSSFEQICWNT